MDRYVRIFLRRFDALLRVTKWKRTTNSGAFMKSLLYAVPFITAVLQAAPVGATNGVQLPYTFEQNQGQTDRSVRYLARGRGYSLYLTGREAVLSLQRAGEAPRAVRMSLSGSRAPQAIEPLEPLAQRTNYFVGQDPARWRRDVPHYSRVRYRGVYAGIDLVYHSQQGQLEYDFVVSPGASASGKLSVAAVMSATTQPGDEHDTGCEGHCRGGQRMHAHVFARLIRELAIAIPRLVQLLVRARGRVAQLLFARLEPLFQCIDAFMQHAGRTLGETLIGGGRFATRAGPILPLHFQSSVHV